MHSEGTVGVTVVYGDEDTIGNHADSACAIAEGIGLQIKAWHSDPDGTRPGGALDDADGLVSALCDCARFGASLLVPYPVDMPGEQTWRLVAHWLNRHGLRLYLGTAAYCWQHALDELDFAVRRTLDTAHALDAAVVARGAVPTMEALLNQIAGDAMERGTRRAPGALDADQRFLRLRMRRDFDLAAGRDVPEEPDPAAPWPERCLQARAFAAWLHQHTSQSVIADVLNASGVTPPGADRWTQPMVSRLLRGGYAARPGPNVA